MTSVRGLIEELRAHGDKDDADLVEALFEALKLLQGFNWAADDTPHGNEIKRRALAAIKLAESQS